MSDHCPVILELLTPFQYPFDFINDCVEGFLSYKHYDITCINYKLKKVVKLSCCDLKKLFSDLDNLGNELLAKYNNRLDTKNKIESLNRMTTNGIKEICKKMKKSKNQYIVK